MTITTRVRNGRTSKNSTPTPRTTASGGTPGQLGRASQKEYPLIPVKPRFLDWDMSFSDPSQGYQLMPSTCEASSAVISPEQPTVFFCGDVYAEIMHIVKEAGKKTGECGGFAFIKRVNQYSSHWVVYDHFMVGQKATGGDVEFPGDEIVKAVQYYLETYPDAFKDSWDLHTHLLQWHSHGNGSVFWSGTDKAQQEDKAQLAGQGQFRLYSVFNTKGDQKSAIRVYDPVASMHDDIAMGIFNGPDGSRKAALSKERKAELDGWIEQLVDKKYTYGAAHMGGGVFDGYPYDDFNSWGRDDFYARSGSRSFSGTRNTRQGALPPTPHVGRGESKAGKASESKIDRAMSKVLNGLAEFLRKSVPEEDIRKYSSVTAPGLNRIADDLSSALGAYLTYSDGLEEMVALIFADLLDRITATNGDLPANIEAVTETLDSCVSAFSVNLDLIFDALGEILDMEESGLTFREAAAGEFSQGWNIDIVQILEDAVGNTPVVFTVPVYLDMFE